MNDIAINGRYTRRRLTGAQRYAHELAGRLAGASTIAPKEWSLGIRGHAWEQFALPLAVGGRVLWSPTNSGPLATRRQVLTIHDTVSIEHPEWLNPRFVRWYRWLLPRLSQRVAAITTVSEFSRQRIHEALKVPLDRIEVIYNAASPWFVQRTAEECRRALAPLHLPERPYILSVCSLEPRKNLGTLLAAWAALETRIPPETLLVVVGAPGADNVFATSAAIRNSGRVRSLGYVDDTLLPYLYAGADAFVYPSLYEGFGLPPLEAMACGVPVLVGDRTAMPEVVGDAALQCDVVDPVRLADGIERICLDEELRSTLRYRGPARARRFDWNESAAQLQRLLGSVA